jgi:hypothetical protein
MMSRSVAYRILIGCLIALWSQNALAEGENGAGENASSQPSSLPGSKLEMPESDFTVLDPGKDMKNPHRLEDFLNGKTNYYAGYDAF